MDYSIVGNLEVVVGLVALIAVCVIVWVIWLEMEANAAIWIINNPQICEEFCAKYQLKVTVQQSYQPANSYVLFAGDATRVRMKPRLAQNFLKRAKKRDPHVRRDIERLSWRSS
jgi:hypothetical protein